MKKTINLFTCTFIMLAITSSTAIAQSWIASGADLITNNTNNVGIGTSSPTDKLTINGDHLGFIHTLSSTSYRHINGRSPNKGLAILASQDWIWGSGIVMNGWNNSSNQGDISFVSAYGFSANAGTGSAFSYWLAGPSGSWDTRLLDIDKSGMFTLNGNIAFDNTHNTNPRYIQGNSDENVAIYGNNGYTDGAAIAIAANNSTLIGSGEVSVVSGGNLSQLSTQNPDRAFNIAQFGTGQGQFTPHFTVFKNGKVRIGDASLNINTTNEYRLYVQTGILTEKVKVALSSDPTNWSDFVFDDDYELQPLSEVEEYILKNKHLPEIPSTEEVHANGLDLAQMDAKLLQKVEELTLYIIQQQKDIIQQQNEINQLKSKLNK